MSKRISLFKLKGSSTKDGPPAPAATSSNGNGDASTSSTAPPAYNDISTDATLTDGVNGQSTALPPDGHNDVKVNINAAFADLTLEDAPGNPTVDKCLSHLKLLFAIHDMREDVGYTDGLWDIWDTRESDRIRELSAKAEKAEKSGAPGAVNPDEATAVLSNLREKRWAIFLARAVDRYASWWETLPKRYLTNADMEAWDGTIDYYNFVNGTDAMVWDETMLPPLGKYCPYQFVHRISHTGNNAT